MAEIQTPNISSPNIVGPRENSLDAFLRFNAPAELPIITRPNEPDTLPPEEEPEEEQTRLTRVRDALLEAASIVVPTVQGVALTTITGLPSNIAMPLTAGSAAITAAVTARASQNREAVGGIDEILPVSPQQDTADAAQGEPDQQGAPPAPSEPPPGENEPTPPPLQLVVPPPTERKPSIITPPLNLDTLLHPKKPTTGDASTAAQVVTPPSDESPPPPPKPAPSGWAPPDDKRQGPADAAVPAQTEPRPADQDESTTHVKSGKIRRFFSRRREEQESPPEPLSPQEIADRGISSAFFISPLPTEDPEEQRLIAQGTALRIIANGVPVEPNAPIFTGTPETVEYVLRRLEEQRATIDNYKTLHTNLKTFLNRLRAEEARRQSPDTTGSASPEPAVTIKTETSGISDKLLAQLGDSIINEQRCQLPDADALHNQFDNFDNDQTPPERLSVLQKNITDDITEIRRRNNLFTYTQEYLTNRALRYAAFIESLDENDFTLVNNDARQAFIQRQELIDEARRQSQAARQPTSEPPAAEITTHAASKQVEKMQPSPAPETAHPEPELDRGGSRTKQEIDIDELNRYLLMNYDDLTHEAENDDFYAQTAQALLQIAKNEKPSYPVNQMVVEKLINLFDQNPQYNNITEKLTAYLNNLGKE